MKRRRIVSLFMRENITFKTLMTLKLSIFSIKCGVIKNIEFFKKWIIILIISKNINIILIYWVAETYSNAAYLQIFCNLHIKNTFCSIFQQFNVWWKGVKHSINLKIGRSFSCDGVIYEVEFWARDKWGNKFINLYLN